MSEIRKKAIRGLQEGDQFKIRRCFTKREVEQFADLTRDYNPVHFEERFTRAKKLKGPICHGLLVASILTEIGGQIGWLASGMDFHFLRPVYVGESIECCLTITAVDERNRAHAKAVYTNQEGTIVLEADLKGILPGQPERQVLAAMIAEGDPTNKVR